MHLPGDSISLMQIIASEIPALDKYWFVCNKVASAIENKLLAISLAELCLPLYENHPDFRHARNVIEAAKLHVKEGAEFLDSKKCARDYASISGDTNLFHAVYTLLSMAVCITLKGDDMVSTQAMFAAVSVDDALNSSKHAEQLKVKFLEILFEYANNN